jgi:serine/threonine protein kinase
MHYAMLYGHLPFWGDTEEEFIDKITNAPLKFDADVPVTEECKEVLRQMLQKNPEKRTALITLIQNEYFIVDDEDIEVKVRAEEERLAKIQKDEEEKAAASKLEDKFYDGLLLSKPVGASAEPKKSGGAGSGKNASSFNNKTPGAGAKGVPTFGAA